VVSIQSSYTSPSKYTCFSPFENLVSCSFLTSCLYSLNYLFCGDVIYGTSCFYSLSYPSCGDVICGTSHLYSFNYPSCGDVICGTSYLYSLNCPSCGDAICGTFVSLLALLVPLLALQMVPLCPLSFYVPLLMCFLVPFSLLNLRLLLP
jgi:hypothetical protein